MHCLILSVAWVQGAAFFLPQRSWKANKSQINFPHFSKIYIVGGTHSGNSKG